MVLLAFLPEPDPDDTVSRYEVFLINDTAFQALFTCAFYLRDALQDRMSGILEPHAFRSVGFLFLKRPNDQPCTSWSAGG